MQLYTAYGPGPALTQHNLSRQLFYDDPWEYCVCIGQEYTTFVTSISVF